MKSLKKLRVAQALVPNVEFPKQGNHQFYQVEKAVLSTLRENLPGEIEGDFDPHQKLLYIEWHKQVCLPEILRRTQNYGNMKLQFSVNLEQDLEQQVRLIIEQVEAVMDWSAENEHVLLRQTRERMRSA